MSTEVDKVVERIAWDIMARVLPTTEYHEAVNGRARDVVVRYYAATQDATSALRQQVKEAEGHVEIVLSALRMLEEATGETFDDEGGDIAAIERAHLARYSRKEGA